MGHSNVSGGMAYRRLTARPIIGWQSAQGGHVYQLIDLLFFLGDIIDGYLEA